MSLEKLLSFRSAKSIIVKAEHTFETIDKRDDYYRDNPQDLIEGDYCIALEHVYQYVNGKWENVTMLWTGARGATGPVPDFKIGSVTDGDISFVGLVQTGDEVTINMVLKQGERGERGETGASGIDHKGMYDPEAVYSGKRDGKGYDAVRYTVGDLGGSFFCISDVDISGISPAKLDGDNNPILDGHGNLTPNAPYWELFSLYGVAGEDGKPASVTIGGVQFVSDVADAKIENLGTAQDVVLGMHMPIGPKGDTGPRGVTWIRGGYNNNKNHVFKKDEACYHNGTGWIANMDDIVGIEPSEENSLYWDILLTSIEPKLVLDDALGESKVAFEGFISMVTGGQTPIIFIKPAAQMPRGYQLCDGTNGTPDMRDQFIQGATSDSQLATKVLDTTRIPRNAPFALSDVTHSHKVNPPNTSTTGVSHTHSVSGQDINTESSGSHNHGVSDPGHYHKTPADSASGVNGGGDGDWVINNGDGNSRNAYTYTAYTNIGIQSGGSHKHLVRIPAINTSSNTHSHSVDISEFNSGINTHTHTLSGGDAVTAPKHIYFYWIMYTGSLAPNWNS